MLNTYYILVSHICTHLTPHLCSSEQAGGGTKFNYLNFTATPKKGGAIVWPSMTDDMKEQNDWTWHQALPVEKGIKYGVSLCLLHHLYLLSYVILSNVHFCLIFHCPNQQANAWLHIRNYQDVPDHC